MRALGSDSPKRPAIRRNRRSTTVCADLSHGFLAAEQRRICLRRRQIPKQPAGQPPLQLRCNIDSRGGIAMPPRSAGTFQVSTTCG